MLTLAGGLLLAGCQLANQGGQPAPQGSRALVVCPPGDDAGCERIVEQLEQAVDGTTPLFAGGVDTAFEDLRDMPLSQLQRYALVFVPSLGDTELDLLREGEVGVRLQQILRGRVAAWSGTPDRSIAPGPTSEPLVLIENLARWAAAGYEAEGAAGLVLLQDLSAGGMSARYDWVEGVAGVDLEPDVTTETYDRVEKNPGNPAAEAIVGSLAYEGMASSGFILTGPDLEIGAWGELPASAPDPRGAVVLATAIRQPTPCQVVGADGDVLVFESGSVVLAFPADALSEDWCVSVTDSAVVAGSGYVAGTAFAFGPSGLSFPHAPAVTLTIGYAEADIPAGGSEDDLRIFTLTEIGWAEIPGSTVDTDENTVTASLDSFSQYAVFDRTLAAAPVAGDDAYSTDEDVPLSVPAPGVLANDTDPNGDTLAAVLVTGPAHGTLALNADGSFSYTPNLNFFGTDGFTYVASDGTSDSNEATVTITVNLLNDAPVADDDAYSVDEDATADVPAPGVLGNDADPNGDALVARLLTGPDHGTLDFGADGSFTYVPNENYNGTDTFTYEAFDGRLASEPATVTITVQPVNDAPVVVDDAYATDEDTPLVVAAPGVLANDVDVDGDTLTPSVVDAASHGTIALNVDGSFTYTPNADFNGVDQFTYKVNDGTLDSAGAATVTITVNAVNDAPVAADDAYATSEDVPLTVLPGAGVLANDTDAEGDALTAILVTGPSNGTLTLNPDGSFTYTPDLDYNGTDQFTYQANDGTTDSNVATVTITIGPENDAPVAVDDAYPTDEDTTLNVVASVGVLANDTDAEGDALTAILVTGPSNGTLTLNSDGSFTFTPNPNFSGTDTFTYRANDGFLNSNTATVTITVTAVNDPPVASADGYDALGNVLVPIGASMGVLANDSDVDGDPLSAVAGTITTLNGGTVQMSADGSFTYVSAAGFTGSDSFTYTVSDGTDSSSATVTMSVTGRYWFVDSTAPAGGDGRQTAKFQNLTPLDGSGGAGDPDQWGDVLLVASGTYASAIELEIAQQLIGQGIPADLTATVNGESLTLLAAGTAPRIDTASGSAITLSSDNTLRGLVAGSAPGVAIAGVSVGTLSISDVVVDNPAGRALDISTSGSLSAAFGSITASGGTGNGIHLANLTGTLTSGSTTITNPSGTGIHVVGPIAMNLGSTVVDKSGTAGMGIYLQGLVGTTSFPSLAVTTSGGTGLVADNAGTLAVTGGSIGATGGPAIDATNTAFSGTGFTSTTSTNSATTGLRLVGASGTLSLGSGSISGSTGNAVDIDGGAANVSYAGNISKSSAGNILRIQGRSGGAALFSGNLAASASSAGILLQNNTGGAAVFSGTSKNLATGANPAVSLVNNSGATIDFTNGGLVLATTTGTGLSATGGGLLSVGGGGNTISSSGAPALSVSNTTIGSGLTFQSISANGGTSGILLANTGTNAGLTVTGTGTSGSGGTIQNIAGRGVSIASARSIVLQDMQLASANTTDAPSNCTTSTNTGCYAAIHLSTVNGVTLDGIAITGTTTQMAINGSNVTGFRLVDSTATNCGNEVGEGCLRFTNLLGTSEITRSDLGPAAERVAYISNNATGTLNLTVTDSTFRDTQTSAVGADGLELEVTGTGSTANLDITGSSFLRNKTAGLQAVSGGSASTVRVDVSGSIFDVGTGVGRGLDLAASSTGRLEFNVIGNTGAGIEADGGTAIAVNALNGSTVMGRIHSNVIRTNVNGTAGGSGIDARVTGLNNTATMRLSIENNTISGVTTDDGIRLISREGTGRLDATVVNNTITVGSGAAFDIEVGVLAANIACADLRNNAASGTGLAAFGLTTSDAASTAYLEGFSVNAVTTWNNRGNTPVGSVIESHNGTRTGATCLEPTHSP